MLSLFEVKKYHKRLKQNFSDIEKLKLDWLIYLLIGIIIVWSFEFVQIILIELLSEPENIVFNYIYVVISVSMYAVAFKSLKQPEIFIQSYPLEKNIVEDAAASSGEDKNTSYKKSGLSDEKAALLINTLGTIMSTDKPYKTANLSLNDLAEMLSITPHNLSEIINTKLNKTFYDYISAYRVEEVKQLMKEDKNEVYSILSIALDAGFNSKSAFNNIFKKTTGITPSEYRKSLKN
jgi:AraC-type DNA-binding domain-containing proteins